MEVPQLKKELYRMIRVATLPGINGSTVTIIDLQEDVMILNNETIGN